ncbi:MAG TPA: hypothetical protein VG838_17845 [Opitutaceae bacterium]|nr:hypothetical protein [Opitutaceae bacterium]
MKTKRFIQLYTTLAALAVATVVFAPALAAAEKTDAAARKAKQDQENLEKYDKNHDGKLDDEEKAAMKADEEKLAAEKKQAAADKKLAAAERKEAAAEKREAAAEKKAAAAEARKERDAARKPPGQ